MVRRVLLAVVFSIVGAALVPVALFLGVVVVGSKLGLAQTFVIPSASMEPTLHCARPVAGCEAGASDRILVLAHWPGGYGRGDLVAFTAPSRAAAACGARGTFVKRVVGLPGEIVQIRLVGGRGFLFVDGRRLRETYIASASRRRTKAFGPVKVPAGRYFVLGDNRPDSCDSRAWGSLPRRDIVGRAVLRYWPVTRIGFE
jgi:signal peptidase I